MDVSRSVLSSVLSFVLGATLFGANTGFATDITVARQRFTQLLAELEQSKPASIPVEWSAEEAAAGSSPDFYLVTSANCGSCPAAKRNATAAGIDYEEISVNKARSLGLFSASGRVLVPQLICSVDAKDRIIGAHAASKMKTWAEKFPMADDPVMIAAVNSESSLDVIIKCLAAHLFEETELPISSSSLLRKTIITPAFVTEMLAQLMSGDTINVAETGATIEWTGQDRTIQFVSVNCITINPPMTVSVKKLGIRLTTKLESIKINEAGNEIRLGLDGPDITFRFQTNAN